MSTAKVSLVALVAASLWSASGSASSQSARPGAELLDAAERSFSDIPFGAPEATPGLTIIDRDQCDRWGECSYRDADGVEHYFWEGELVVKTIQTADVGNGQIDALGIGSARSLDVVLGRVERFLPGAKIECQDMGDGNRNCGATLGEGWISLKFDDSRRLTEVRIDAYHFT